MKFFNTITHYFKNVISKNNENQKQDIEKTISDLSLKLDIENSIRNNDDELSILLLDKADQTNEEISFVKDQLNKSTNQNVVVVK
jgi:fructose-1-phosphate kinase PfkB-like protein